MMDIFPLNLMEAARTYRKPQKDIAHYLKNWNPSIKIGSLLSLDLIDYYRGIKNG